MHCQEIEYNPQCLGNMTCPRSPHPVNVRRHRVKDFHRDFYGCVLASNHERNLALRTILVR